MELYAMQETGKDELGNPIKESVLIGEYRGKITQWTSEEIALLDRTITQTQRKLLTDAPKNVIEQAEQVEIDGVTYTLINVKSDFIRWRLCHVKERFT